MNKKPNILLVDGEEVFLRTLASVLSDRDFDVHVVYSGSDALRIYKSGYFDIVVTDLNMPAMGGVELITKIRGINPQQRIVLITGTYSGESQVRELGLDTVSFLAKPFSMDRFVEVICETLEIKDGESVGEVKLNFDDLLRLCVLRGESIVLEFFKGDEKGVLYFEAGKLIHAKTRSRFGKKAFHEIRSWGEGTFRVKPLRAAVVHSITQSIDALLRGGGEPNRELSFKQESNNDN